MKFALTSIVDHYFKCTTCGLCCKGSVELTPSEYERIIRLAESLGLRVPIEFRDYVVHVKIIMKPLEDQEGEKWCCFLKREGPRRALCRIYDQRPAFCRLYPLYVGISRELGTVFVDVVHCPEVRHEPRPDYVKVDESYVREEVSKVFSYNPEILNCIPDLDRDVAVVELGDRVILTKLHKKFEIVRQINKKLEEQIRPDMTWLQLLAHIMALQYAIRDVVGQFLREMPSPQEVVNTILRETPSRVRQEIVSDAEIMYYVATVLGDVGLRIDLDKYAVHDASTMKIRLADLTRDKLNTPIGDMILYIREILARFPVFYQFFYLPLEMIYSHSYFAVFAVTALYSTTLRDLEPDVIMASIDMGGLPYVFKYVSGLVKIVYTTQLQDRHYIYLES